MVLQHKSSSFKRKYSTLSNEAYKLLSKKIHPLICFLPGLYSRGKSHLIRLAVAVHLLLTFWNNYERSAMTRSSNIEPESVNDACNQGPSGIDDTHSNAGNDEESVMEEDVQEDDSHTGLAAIDRQATEIASSLVKTCLSQLCKCLHD